MGFLLLTLLSLLSFASSNADGFHTNVSSFRWKKHEKGCDIFHGSWVYDETYPLYGPWKCPFIRKEFDCHKYGRPDSEYQRYRWQPQDCVLPRFNGVEFLTRFRGKKIMFVGDSLSLNFWQSLICLLHAAMPQATIIKDSNETLSTITFQEYQVSVILHHTLYLVDVEKEEYLGRVLKLDKIKSGSMWKNMDILIFNTYQWWGRRGPKQPWDCIEEGGKIYEDMDRTLAFRKGLTTWAKWVNSEVDFMKTKIFFQGISPSHYKGKDWGEPELKNCHKETEPIKGSTYPGGVHPATKIVNDVLGAMQTPVYLLDVTTLSQLRKDGHPSSYNGFKGMDCTHWCIPGLPDTWSQLLYTILIHS